MRLQVLVPHFDEEPSEIRPLLDSLALQQAVDLSEIGVIVAHDGPEAPSIPDWDYPFAIEETRLSGHQGVSAARNAALGMATADYVMFSDFDDMLYNACGLHILWREMAKGFDALSSNFTEEARDADGNPTYVRHELDQTFVHGKVYRQEWLESEGIRFDPTLTVHEDGYFVALAQELAGRAVYCPEPFYLWRWRDSSVCRRDPDYILKTYPQVLDACDALAVELARRGRADAARLRVGAMVLDAYYTMNKPEWVDKVNMSRRSAVERRFARFLRGHMDEWESLSDVERMAASAGIRDRSVMEGMGMESMTLAQWLREVLR